MPPDTSVVTVGACVNAYCKQLALAKSSARRGTRMLFTMFIHAAACILNTAQEPVENDDTAFFGIDGVRAGERSSKGLFLELLDKVRPFANPVTTTVLHSNLKSDSAMAASARIAVDDT